MKPQSRILAFGSASFVLGIASPGLCFGWDFAAFLFLGILLLPAAVMAGLVVFACWAIWPEDALRAEAGAVGGRAFPLVLMVILGALLADQAFHYGMWWRVCSLQDRSYAGQEAYLAAVRDYSGLAWGAAPLASITAMVAASRGQAAIACVALLPMVAEAFCAIQFLLACMARID